MSGRSSSSREASPRRFRSPSPASEDESVASQGSWHPTSTTLHPSSFQTASLSNVPVLRQPVGFGAGSAPAPSYHPAPIQAHPNYHSPAADVPTGDQSSSRKRSSKGKDKGKESSRQSKQRNKGASSHSEYQHPQCRPYPEQPPPESSIQRTAFRVRRYANDPTAGGSPYTIQQGPYGATYRAEVAEPLDNGRSQQATSQSHPRAQPQPVQSTIELQPRSYYRHDYDKACESAPANRAKQAAKAAATPPPAPMYHHNAPPVYQQPYSYSNPTPTTNPDGHHRSSRTSKRKDTHHHVYPTQQSYPGPTQDYGETYDPPPPEYYNPPAPPPAQFAPVPSTHAPSPAPSREKSHKSRSRSHRHEQPQYAPPVPVQPPPPPPQPEVQPPSIRVCRVLTLLIEDKRNGEDENMLTEVRVPLKEIGGGDVSFWADAQEVTEELQKGPSRIDGRAKVYTLRGKYKQYFLRISHDGEETCQSANLKVAADRTLELFIEDNPPPANLFLPPPLSPSPRMERELLTPVTDSRNSPSPAPVPLPAHKRASRSSLFSADDLPSPSADEQKFDVGGSFVASSRKRPRSSSLQSIQSVRSESCTQPQLHSSFSPFTSRSPSVKPSIGSHSRTPSQASPPPPHLQAHDEFSQMSPVSPFTDLPTPQPGRTHPPPAQPTKASSFSTISHATPFAQPAFTPSPSPPKKTKLAASEPQQHIHIEHSVSPGPSQPGTYPWSHSRTPSVSKEPSSSLGFLSFASSSARRSSLSTSVPVSSPFSQYDPGPFSLPTPQSEPSTTPASHSNLALPSMSAPFAVPIIPSLSSVSTPMPVPTPTVIPTTVAPSAMSVTPTLSGHASLELDNTVGKYIRGIISKERAWETFVQNRARNLTMREQLAQYAYVQGIIDRFIGGATPADLEGAGGVRVTKTQVMRAFNLPLAWGEECTETLVLTGFYGGGGSRGEEPRVVKMLDETNPISTGMLARKYLALLREVHRQWAVDHPE